MSRDFWEKNMDFGNQENKIHFIHALSCILPLSSHPVAPAPAREDACSLEFRCYCIQSPGHQEKSSRELQQEQVWTLEALNPGSYLHPQPSEGFGCRKDSVPKTTVDFWGFHSKTGWSNRINSPFAPTLGKVHEDHIVPGQLRNYIFVWFRAANGWCHHRSKCNPIKMWK